MTPLLYSAIAIVVALGVAASQEAESGEVCPVTGQKIEGSKKSAAERAATGAALGLSVIGAPAIAPSPPTRCWVRQQIVSIETLSEAKYSTAKVGTTLSLALVWLPAGKPPPQ